MQRHHAVATCRVGQRVGRRVGAFGVGIAIDPRVGVAFGHLVDAGVAVIDGQVQRHHAVATCHVGQRVGRRVGAFGVGVAVNPCVGVAFGHLVNTCIAVIDGQVQRHHTVAACRVGQCMSRCVSAFGVGVAVDPCVAVAFGHLIDAVGSCIHRQSHGHHRVAAVGGGQDGILRAGRVEHHIIPSVGQFSLTDRSCVRSGRNIAFLNHKVIHGGSVVVLALTAYNDVSCTSIANRHFVGVPARFCLSRDYRITQGPMAWDKGQFGGTGNFAVCAGKNPDTFTLI